MGKRKRRGRRKRKRRGRKKRRRGEEEEEEEGEEEEISNSYVTTWDLKPLWDVPSSLVHAGSGS